MTQHSSPTPSPAAPDRSDVWARLVREIDDFTENLRELPVMEKVGPERLRDHLRSRYRFEGPKPLDDVAEDVIGMFRRWNVQVAHPRYFGLFNPSTHEAGMAGDLLAALFNPHLASWSHAAAANEIEHHVLEYFRVALGLPEDAASTFTTGGFEANLSAVSAALTRSIPEIREEGLFGSAKRPTVYVTSETHHSFVKILRICGLGTKSLRGVPVGDDLRMDADALESHIAQDRAEGFHPLMVVGTAGTTSAGIVDPLPRLAEIAEREDLWLHVDGAWGASAVLAPSLRGELEGIERSDSITWDAHKWLSAPMGAGMFFCRRGDDARRAFSTAATYMPDTVRRGIDDPYSTTVQWSRRAIGLKVFMSLAELGGDGLARLVERQAEMGERLRERLRDAGWIVVNDTRLPVVCFTHPDIQDGRTRTSEILRKLYRRGKVWISDVVLAERVRALRACITSFRTDERDLDCLIDELETVRRDLAAS